jgi:asparagine synthase (glutamine-hydrolysing)
MCGIAGLVSSRAAIPPGVIARMTGTLQHRGPDGQHAVEFPGCHLGHTRLSILDLVGGDQPMTEETERYWIVFNGEIFNYRELRRTLEEHSWAFRTHSDTEVLLRAYQEYGETVLSRLNGQFAFAIWDLHQRKLFAARDRLGEKPLYWADSSDGRYFLFASEIKSLLASGLVQPRIDCLSIDAYLGLYYVPPRRTVYENVHTLPPGHALSWQEDDRRIWCYWEPTFSHTPVADIDETIETIRFLIGQAVQRQMVADVPVGAFLSGGLDSSTIVAHMAKHTTQPVKTFSVGFGDLIDELPYARQVAELYHTDHAEIQMGIPVAEMLERMADAYDEPFADSSNIPTYLMAEFARQHVKVVLSGDGGDELFGGYAWYELLLRGPLGGRKAITQASMEAPRSSMRRLIEGALSLLRRRSVAVTSYLSSKANRASRDLWDLHLSNATLLRLDTSKLWGRNEQVYETEKHLRSLYSPGESLSGMDIPTFFDVNCYLPGDILAKVDRAAMAHGLETRAPFLDVDLVEFVWNLPWQVRFQDPAALKYLLRASSAQLWPQSVQGRSKQGFGAPVQNWIHRADVQALVARSFTRGSPADFLLPGARSELPALPAQRQWTLLCLGLWLERHSESLTGIQ